MSSTRTLSLPQVFPATGGKDAIASIRSFDFSKVNTNDNSIEDYLSLFGPDFGADDQMSKIELANLSENAKVAFTSVLMTLSKMPPADRLWDKIHSAMMQNPLVKVDQEQVMRTQTYKFASTKVLGVDVSDTVLGTQGLEKQDVDKVEVDMKRVETWYHNLIGNAAIAKSIGIDSKVLADMFAKAASTVESYFHEMAFNERHEKKLVDVALLQFPTKEQADFKFHRIQFTAWGRRDNMVIYKNGEGGVTGDYNCRTYNPREEVVANISEGGKAAALKLFSSAFGESETT